MANQQLVELIRRSIIGDEQALEGPFGLRRVTYADYTASGRGLDFIESFIRTEVLPLYANTHTESSGTGLQTTRFREDARRLLLEAVGGTDDEDVVIFCGAGATAAINKLIGILNITLPANLDDQFGFSDQIPKELRPVVFIGPYEHHSNELPWRESIADVVVIGENSDGLIDQLQLARELAEHVDRPLKIGSFSAASNVTGIKSEVSRITRLLHEHGALAFWDYAAAAPYTRIEMTKPSCPSESLDAVFLSPHKLIGGPGTPGVLVAKRHLFTNRVPDSPGGGTVAYVSTLEHDYLDDPVVREEGGTPEIVGSIRAGLVFQLKQAIGTDLIEELEKSFITRAIDSWASNDSIRVLGNANAPRLSIVSFMIKHRNRYLHHDFVVAVLNDLFGIQARGGCACAGPYGHRLLGIDSETSKNFEGEILRGCEGIKPGWTRVNFNYFISEQVFEFLLKAVHFVADEGWKLLPLYRFDSASGRWTHRQGHIQAPMGIADISYQGGSMSYASRRMTLPESALADSLAQASGLVEAAVSEYSTADCAEVDLPDEAELLRWFPLPEEILAELAPGI